MIRIAGRSGVPNFYDYTWFELMEFAYGKTESIWESASYIASFIVNVNVTKKSHMKTPDDLNPFKEHERKKKKKKKATPSEIEQFAGLLFS